ncbi:MAG: hypothetical protein WBN20_14445, partial [Eudoraea sp.]|uniref:hypothetical protein n=1 Tax=Eudoraea sp. TaxID=1979955 RepID=UPI003C75C01B
MTSLPLASKNEYPAQNTKTAKNGIKNTAAPFKENTTAVINAANIADHHGRKNEKTTAKTSVAIKLRILIFI